MRASFFSNSMTYSTHNYSFMFHSPFGAVFPADNRVLIHLPIVVLMSCFCRFCVTSLSNYNKSVQADPYHFAGELWFTHIRVSNPFSWRTTLANPTPIFYNEFLRQGVAAGSNAVATKILQRCSPHQFFVQQTQLYEGLFSLT